MNNEHQNDPIRLLPLAEVMRRTGRAKSRVYNDVRDGAFPKPVKDGSSVRWIESEIDAWIIARIAARDSAMRRPIGTKF